ncbi:MAG: sulfite exporter TauE/SafE family protein [SAR86 cluster bacterium]|nr:sulfite exporter TauE/SafE family protein [SAR86 cluster bacterium]
MLGSFSGVLAGLFGIGGGIIIIPTFFYIFSYLAFPDEILSHMVLGSSLGVIAFSSISSTFSHHSKGAVNWRLIKVVAPSIVIGSSLGGLTAGYLESSTLQGLVSLFLVVASVQLIFEFPPPSQNPKTNLAGPVIAGGGIGWLSGVFGIGGGIFSVPYFYHRGLKMMHAIGTSAACGIPIAIAGSISYILIGYENLNLPEYSVGYVYLPATIIVGVMSSLTAKFGVNIAHRMKQKKLRIAFAFLVMIMALNLLMR